MRPGVTVLERMIVAARRGAERETTKRLAAVLDEPGRALLDRLLVPDGSTDRTLLTWIRQGEVATTPTAILSALERRATLIGWGVDRWDLQALHPNRLKFLARLGKRSTNQAPAAGPGRTAIPDPGRVPPPGPGGDHRRGHRPIRSLPCAGFGAGRPQAGGVPPGRRPDDR